MENTKKEDFKFNMEAVEQSFSKYEMGAIINATVVRRVPKGFVVNIGGKHDGLIRESETGEFSSLSRGVRIDVMITEPKGDEGYVIVSAKRAEEVIAKNAQIPAVRDGGVFETTISNVTHNGLVSRFGSYKVFVPASEISQTFVKDLKVYNNKTLRLVATAFDDENKEIIASAKAVALKEKIAGQAEFWDNMFVNKVVKGRVIRFAPFGVFVKVSEVDCLLHNSEVSYDRYEKVSDVLKIDNEYDFKIISLDRENGRVQLSFKAIQEHPFVNQIKAYKLGDIIDVEIKKVLSFGAIAKLPNGLEGLIPTSEASNRFVKAISQVVKEGDTRKVQIINIDNVAHKITLSIKSVITPEEEELNNANKAKN
ncbi:MAG: S1 RNA-binding domain-containing protein [Firmicutes bacterium]|nr:S1 RNA-binding domain-containing protein [Bacillota bacterium]